ncbi:hypothetical protein DP939_04565 [Spongiactinospora rosea]|uniref:Uncharacterized protein n=1 Tax=Spongiactinospora rosea TaxID=2248750 RepID=A0A366M6S3_9ACTN|nr:hypothetical protein [Spongiactinospora rosea]RBQ21948.1 hypothetical protein DP939_04565 [Spongiactinospora rosea]
MEDALTSLGRAGFSPGTALDILYLGVAAGREPDSSLLSGELTPGEFPLLSAAVTAGREPAARFGFALDAMPSGFEAARGPGRA